MRTGTFMIRSIIADFSRQKYTVLLRDIIMAFRC